MRTREEIESDIPTFIDTKDKLILEVLLDIRSMLALEEHQQLTEENDL